MRSLIAAALLALSASQAQALSVNFSFVTNAGTAPGSVVSGRFDGLAEGNNAGPGITATITDAFSSSFFGGGYTFVPGSLTLNSNAFVVSSGVVTFGDGEFSRAAGSLSQDLFVGGFGGGYAPQLTDNLNYNLIAGGFGFQFTPVGVPEPASLAVAGIGLLGLAAARRRVRLG